jgi:hypothetical protein
LSHGVARAVSFHQGNRHESRTICVESGPPGIDLEDVKADIADIVVKWENVPSLVSSSGVIDLTLQNCNGTEDIKVSYSNTNPGHIASFDGTNIKFFDVDWCVESAGVCEATDFSYQGLFLHEIGHAVGAGHAGGCVWNSGNDGCDAS